MRQFIRFVNSLFLIIIFTTGCLVSLARTQPYPQLPPFIASLHLTECNLPCWIGIVPGQTTITDALQHITAIYGHNPDYRITFRSNDSRYGIILENPATGLTISIFPDQFDLTTVVQLIVFSFRDQNISIGDLRQFCFDPKHIVLWPTRGTGTISLVCKNYNFGIEISGVQSNVITANTVANGLIIAGETDSVSHLIYNYNALKWHGFGIYPTILDLWSHYP